MQVMKNCIVRRIVALSVVCLLWLSSFAQGTEVEMFLQSLCKSDTFHFAVTQSEVYPWVVYNNGVVPSNKQSDTNSSSWFTLDVFVPEDSAVVDFDFKVTYYKMYGGWMKFANLLCYVDEHEVFRNNGTDNWEHATFKVSQGRHTLKWSLNLGSMVPANYSEMAQMKNLVIEGISDECVLPQINKHSLSLYSRQPGEQVRDTVTITNRGKEILSIAGIEGLNAPFYAHVDGTTSLGYGEETSVVVEYCPDYEGYDSGQLSIVTNAGSYPIPLTGMTCNGYVVVSNTPGTLNQNLKDVNCERVTIIGNLNTDDQYYLNKLKSCKFLDLSCTNITVITNGGINNLWKLETIVLPKTLKVLDTTWTNSSTYDKETGTWLNYFALKNIFSYASEPPLVLDFYGEGSSQEQPLGNLRPSTRLYVMPEDTASYLNDSIWNKLTVVPLSVERKNGVIDVAVDDISRYAGMKLELVNASVGTTQSITMENRSNYIFNGLLSHYIYYARVLTPGGRELGRTLDFSVDTISGPVILDNIAGLYNVDCKVLDAYSIDISQETGIRWIDAKGQVIADGNSIRSQVEGDSITCEISLGEELGRMYVSPEPRGFRIEDIDTVEIVQLTQIRQSLFNGTVEDAVFGKPVPEAKVLITQYLNGKYPSQILCTTDERGTYVADLYADSTVVTISAEGYEALTARYEDSDSLLSHPVVRLQPLDGVRVNMSLKHVESVADTTAEGGVLPFNDYSNIAFQVRNITSGQDISRQDFQYPILTLLENSAVGDSISITLVSKSNAFPPVDRRVKVDEDGTVQAEFIISDYGSIRSALGSSNNQVVAAMLYGENGQWIKKADYIGGEVSFDQLSDGVYILVAMASDDGFNSARTLAALKNYGLNEYEHYVSDTVMVRQGIISEVDFEFVPLLDAQTITLTGNNTSFNTNKSEVTAGDYVTLNAIVDFKPELAERVTNVALCVDLPDGMSFVEHSAMIGSRTTDNVSKEGNRITIPLAHVGERVRFCVLPASVGSFIPVASVRFAVDGVDMLRPVGSTSISVSDITMEVPSVTSREEFVVSGKTQPAAEVVIYDGNVPVGRTTALKNGMWYASIKLDNPYHMSTHEISAEVNTVEGVQLHSEAKSVKCNKTLIEVSKVTMLHDNPEMRKTYQVVYDFISPNPTSQNYIYYIYNKKFTFLVELTDNDPEKINRLTVNVETGKGKVVPLEATYDSIANRWIAVGEFGNMYDGDVPVNVTVSLSQKPQMLIDDDLLDRQYGEYLEVVNRRRELSALHDAQQARIEEIFSKDAVTGEDVAPIFRDMLSGIGVDPSELDALDADAWEPGDDEETEEELVNQFEEFYSKDEELFARFAAVIPDDIYGTWEDRIEGYTIQTVIAPVEGSEEQYLAAGYSKMESTQGYGLLYKCEEFNQSVVSLRRNIMITTTVTPVEERAGLPAASRARPVESTLNDVYRTLVDNYLDGIIDDLVDGALDAAERYYSHEFLKYARKVAHTSRRLPFTKSAFLNIAEKNLRRMLTVQNIKQLVANLGRVVNLAMEDALALWEEKKQLDVIDNRMPEVYDCAWMRYTDEIQSMYEDMFEYRKEIGRAGGRRIAMNLTNGIQNAWAQFFAGTAADVFEDYETRRIWQGIDNYIDMISDFNRSCVEEERQKYYDEQVFTCPTPDTHFDIDPSGYVYETVLSNRLQGVKATCYYKETYEDMYGDKKERIVLWNAAEHGQKNPLYTDENGQYRWDVPQGLWRVQFEKEGYETTCSDWLPVPPPQLDINVAMRQTVRPVVVSASLEEDGARVAFSKYMLPSSLQLRNFSLKINGEEHAGAVVLLNEEAGAEGDAGVYASKVWIQSDIPLEKEMLVTLMVDGNVRSYANVAMGDNYSCTLALQPMVRNIEAAPEITVHVGDTVFVPVKVGDAEAASGRTLQVSNTSDLILEVTEAAVLDAEASAEMRIVGKLEGKATLCLSMEGTDVRKDIAVDVVRRKVMQAASPVASVADGDTITAQTPIVLTSEHPHAVIFYTLDGTCPCEAAGRVRYSEPVYITDDVELKAMCAVPGMYDSEVVVYHYHLDKSTGLGETVKDGTFDVNPKIAAESIRLAPGCRNVKRVEIFDVSGTLRLSFDRPLPGEVLNLHALSAGNYLVVGHMDGNTQTVRIIKK